VHRRKSTPFTLDFSQQCKERLQQKERYTHMGAIIGEIEIAWGGDLCVDVNSWTFPGYGV